MGAFSVEIPTQRQHRSRGQDVGRERKFSHGFAGCPLEAIRQIPAVRIDEDDPLHAANQRSILDLQLVAVLKLSAARYVLLNTIEKRPAQAIIAAAAVADTEHKGTGFEAGAAFIGPLFAQVEPFTCSATTLPLASSTVSISGI